MAIKLKDLIAFTVVIIFSIVIWWPSRYLPYFWDGAGYLINTAYDFYNSTSPFLISLHTNFAHPPLFPLLLSIVWRLFGDTRLVSHLVMFPFLPMMLISTYYLVKKILPTTLAIFATTLVALSPTVIAEYINVYVDLPSAALITAGLCLLVYKKWFPSVIFLTLSLLIKLPMFTLIPIFYLLLPKNKRLYLLLPIVTIGIWLIYHYQMTGWLFNEPIRNIEYAKTLTQFFNSFLTFIVEFFIAQGRYVWLLMLIVGGSIIKTNHYKINSQHLTYLKAFSLGILATAVFYIFTAEIAPRYLLYVTPIYALLVSYAVFYILTQLSKNKILQVIILIIPVSILLFYWRPSLQPTTKYDFLAPYNLHVYDYIHSFRQLSATLELIAPNAEIYGGFPEVQMLTEPHQGYVSKPLDFRACNQYAFKPEVSQYIVAHPYAPSQLNCAELLGQIKVIPQARFENNGIWVELYQVDATQSAQLN